MELEGYVLPLIGFGICVECGRLVIGEIPSGECCFTTFCSNCDMYLLEDEVDWMQREDFWSINNNKQLVSLLHGVETK